MVYASTIDGTTLQVKTFNDECNCELFFDKKYIYITYSSLASTYKNRFRQYSKWVFGSFKEIIQLDFMVKVDNWQYYKVRKKANDKVNGSIFQQYNRLFDYCEELKTIKRNLRPFKESYFPKDLCVFGSL